MLLEGGNGEDWRNNSFPYYGMKVAYLLTLYRDAEQANIFIKQLLQSTASVIYIHIDKKSDPSLEKDLLKDERIHIIPQRFDVHWGDYSQIEANLALFNYAKKDSQFDYYSVHSGNDILVRPIDELLRFLEEDQAYAYLDCRKLPDKQFQYGGGLGRIALHWPKVFRKKYGRFSILRVLRSIYGRMYGAGIIKGRQLPAIDFYGQSDWFTLSEACVFNMFSYLENNPEFKALFKDSLIGSELFFNTVAVWTKGEKEIRTTNNLRYIDFDNPDKDTPGSPKLLKIDDYERIIQSNNFFARKVDMHDKESCKLIEKLVNLA